jgi:hypothetical protein
MDRGLFYWPNHTGVIQLPKQKGQIGQQTLDKLLMLDHFTSLSIFHTMQSALRAHPFSGQNVWVEMTFLSIFLLSGPVVGQYSNPRTSDNEFCFSTTEPVLLALPMVWYGIMVFE